MKPPVRKNRWRRAALQSAELPESRFDRTIGQEGAAPVLLQGEQPLGKVVGTTIAETDQITAVLPQDFENIDLGIPTQGTPDDLVDVVVAAFGIGDEADRLVGERAKDRRLVAGAGIDHFATFGQGVSNVPVGNSVLAAQAMSDIGIVADRKLRGHGFS